MIIGLLHGDLFNIVIDHGSAPSLLAWWLMKLTFTSFVLHTAETHAEAHTTAYITDRHSSMSLITGPFLKESVVQTKVADKDDGRHDDDHDGYSHNHVHEGDRVGSLTVGAV